MLDVNAATYTHIYTHIYGRQQWAGILLSVKYEQLNTMYSLLSFVKCEYITIFTTDNLSQQWFKFKHSTA